MKSKPSSIAVVGAGVAGVTLALRLAQKHKCQVTLIEKGPSFVNGPPICHLHAGGNLYREIDQQQCITLLEQSIDTLRFYPFCANIRPTVIAVPIDDSGSPNDLSQRLEVLRKHYAALVAKDPLNRVLGDPNDYFQYFSREQMSQLALQSQPQQLDKPEHWMIELAKQLDFDSVQWPLVLVQEYGLSVFRLAASAELMLKEIPNCELHLNTEVIALKRHADQWQIQVQRHSETFDIEADYLINACGYQSGQLDDMAGFSRQRMVEFKAAYVARWPQVSGHWPELIFHGQRGTPKGMAQFTPYAEQHIQLHGMTEDITLFKGGLVTSNLSSAQPQLSAELQHKLSHGWPQAVIEQRSQRAIDHISRFLPAFSQAKVAGKPLFGAQQIPGDDAELRAADVSFAGEFYARAEIVKANSALAVADAIAGELGLELQTNPPCLDCALNAEQIEQRAIVIARLRHYPVALAKFLPTT
ncbi:FAD-dependent oxidoreductase [Alginatibacterium sediminis]|uniref:FAD-dependent oxidoreductase n=1 Tax=Alginatibacterium sediminis TaxID=2164068 RepID=A0A420EBN0_9ALTE|nr:FAD-dependent oxidoreductase [Alginatibacterium sediminis]RKF18053.1 FAD-dependent oxidoreductase [Alginatibacterium sediminis]